MEGSKEEERRMSWVEANKTVCTVPVEGDRRCEFSFVCVHVCKLRMFDNQGYGPNLGLVGGVNRVRLVGGVNSVPFAYTYVNYACPAIKVSEHICGWSEV